MQLGTALYSRPELLAEVRDGVTQAVRERVWRTSELRSAPWAASKSRGGADCRSGRLNGEEPIVRIEAARERIILAVDAADLDRARDLVERVRSHVGAIKIGKELYTSCGPEALRVLGVGGMPIFLDLKYHDIPNTVAGAVRAAGRLGVRWLSLHTSGGAAMLEAAARARDELPEPRPLLLGVTVLTSPREDDVEEVVDRALLAQHCGLDGAIASPREVRGWCRVRSRFVLVPGVRPAGTVSVDQHASRRRPRLIRDAPIARRTADHGATILQSRQWRSARNRDGAARASTSAGHAADGSVAERCSDVARVGGALEVTSCFRRAAQRPLRACAKLLQHPRHARAPAHGWPNLCVPTGLWFVVSVALAGWSSARSGGRARAGVVRGSATIPERCNCGVVSLRPRRARGDRRRCLHARRSIAECARVVRALGASRSSLPNHRPQRWCAPTRPAAGALRKVEARTYLPDDARGAPRFETVKPG